MIDSISLLILPTSSTIHACLVKYIKFYKSVVHIESFYSCMYIVPVKLELCFKFLKGYPGKKKILISITTGNCSCVRQRISYEYLHFYMT